MWILFFSLIFEVVELIFVIVFIGCFGMDVLVIILYLLFLFLSCLIMELTYYKFVDDS